jgi:hypothetical protein
MYTRLLLPSHPASIEQTANRDNDNNVPTSVEYTDYPDPDQRTIRYHPEKDVMESATKRLPDLTPEECRRFCFKDCALYIVGTSECCLFGQQQLFEKIYRRWYPTRASDVDLSHGEFRIQRTSLDVQIAEDEDVCWDVYDMS